MTSYFVFTVFTLFCFGYFVAWVSSSRLLRMGALRSSHQINFSTLGIPMSTILVQHLFNIYRRFFEERSGYPGKNVVHRVTKALRRKPFMNAIATRSLGLSKLAHKPISRKLQFLWSDLCGKRSSAESLHPGNAVGEPNLGLDLLP